MAAVVMEHVETLGDEEEPHSDDIEAQSGSEGGSADERSDGGASDGEEAEDEDGEDVEDDETNANAGWAEAMAKILGKKTESKSNILIKNKELDKVKERERQEQQERKKLVDKRHAWEMMCRVKPDIVKDRETEKALQRIATRGVVQLFNAVKKHQKTVDDKLKEVGGSERKKAKILSSVSKKDFIDVLRRSEGGGNKTEKATPAAAVEEVEEKPAWSVLRDDFMMGASMKDWDKDSDGETEPQTGAGAEESDSD